MIERSALHLAVALDGAGWHPGAWREPGAGVDRLFTSGYWVELIRATERGLLDLVTIEDGFGLQSGDSFVGGDRRTDQVRGRMDAELVAAFAAPLTGHVGLVPTVTSTHTEPFHVASAISTLDHNSRGRAGWRVQVSPRAEEAAHFGRRVLPEIRRDHLDLPETEAALRELFDEAVDAVEVVRRLWDSWEDDAEIRDAATNRFLDREKVHTVDFVGRFFSVRGPAIVPRPPQGQPLVVALAHAREPYEFAARAADVVFVTPGRASDVAGIVDEVRDAERAVGRTGRPLKVLADLVVLLDEDASAARERLSRLDAIAPLRSDAAIFAGTPTGLADLLLNWRQGGLDGFRLRPAVLPVDLGLIVDELVPQLRGRGVFRNEYEPGTLRERFGLGRPASRYRKAAG